MASCSKVVHFHNALDYALERFGKFEISLKEAHSEALKNIVYNSKDTICRFSTANQIWFFRGFDLSVPLTSGRERDTFFPTAGQGNANSRNENGLISRNFRKINYKQ